MGTKGKCCYSAAMTLSILCALALISPASAAKPVPAKTTFSLVKLHETYKKTSSVEADFTQEVYQASLGRTKTSKGAIKLAKPNLVRWEIFEPEASVMVSDGRKVSYFTPDARGKGKGQVIEKKAQELERQPLFKILAGNAPLNEEFTVEKSAAVEKNGYELSLKPKKPMADLERVKLKVSAKYLIEELNLETHSGNKTKFTLQNQALGAKLPTQLFQFKPPADTEIVRE